MTPPDFLIDSVDNALRVLDMVIERGEVRVRKVATELDMSASSAHRLLATMAYRNFLVQDPTSKIYRLGAKLVNYQAPHSDVLTLRRVMKPHMERITEVTQESVSLSRLMGDHIEFIDGVESPRVLRASPRIGARMPAHATAGGKVHLSHLEPAEITATFPDGLKPVTSATITDLGQLHKQLHLVRQRGYAFSRGESTEDIAAISVAIQDTHQRTLAALTILAPSVRMTDSKMQPFIALLTTTAETVRPLL